MTVVNRGIIFVNKGERRVGPADLAVHFQRFDAPILGVGFRPAQVATQGIASQQLDAGVLNPAVVRGASIDGDVFDILVNSAAGEGGGVRVQTGVASDPGIRRAFRDAGGTVSPVVQRKRVVVIGDVKPPRQSKLPAIAQALGALRPRFRPGNTGSNSAAKIAMMAMTTSSSMRVKAERFMIIPSRALCRNGKSFRSCCNPCKISRGRPRKGGFGPWNAPAIPRPAFRCHRHRRNSACNHPCHSRRPKNTGRCQSCRPKEQIPRKFDRDAVERGEAPGQRRRRRARR